MEVTAQSLLAEIEHEDMQTLLLSVREDVTAIAADDVNIESNSGNNARPLLSHGSVIELQGPSGSGKTHLVFNAVVSCILPQRHADSDLGGWGQAAMVLDTDETFDICRLRQLLDAKLLAAVGEDHMMDGTDFANLRDEALRHLHIFRPRSSSQVAATIMSLPKYHWDEPHIQHREMGLLVVDSLSTFYWEDRFVVEQLRGGQSFSGIDARTPFRHVIAALETLRSTYHPTILVTNWGLTPLNKNTPAPEHGLYFRQHLYPMPPGFVETTPAEGVNQAPTVSESRQAYPGSSAFQAEHPRGQPRALATLPLTHHITLLRYPSLIERTGQQNTDAISRKDDGLNRFKGLIRTPGNPTTAEFVFAVHDFGVTLEPDGIFRR